MQRVGGEGCTVFAVRREPVESRQHVLLGNAQGFQGGFSLGKFSDGAS